MDEPRNQKTVVMLKPRRRTPMPEDLRTPMLIYVVACCGLIVAGWICAVRYVA